MRQSLKAISLPMELTQRSKFAYMLTKGNLNRLRVLRKKGPTYVLKRQVITPKSISNFEGQYLTFPFHKNHQICTRIKLLFVILEVIKFSTVDNLGRRYLTLFIIYLVILLKF